MSARLFTLVDESGKRTWGYVLLDGDEATILDSLDDVPPALRSPRPAITVFAMYVSLRRVLLDALGAEQSNALAARALREIAP